MAKCSRCGKSGFFFKVEPSGTCKDCNRIVQLEADERAIILRISELNSKVQQAVSGLNDITLRQDSIYEEISQKAKADALKEVADQVKAQQALLAEVSSAADKKILQVAELSNEEGKIEKSINLAANKLKKIQTLFKAIQFSIARYHSGDDRNNHILTDDTSTEADEILSTTVKLKFHHMDVRELRKAYQQNEKLIKELLATYQSRYTSKSNATIYKLMVIALEAELQNILYNMSYAKFDKSIMDIRNIIAKYQKISTDGNQNIAPTIAKFIGELEYLFVEAIKIEYEYYIQKERIKEEQRMLREQMRQEAAEKKLLDEQRKKVEQEESKFKSEISQIQMLIQQTNDVSRIQQLQDRICKVQGQLEDVEKKKEGIINLQNGKAGYIYIISNLGSFGDKVFKIGMTRRLEPQERIDELGDASVPFRFDVHSFIFSDNAPKLENSLHQRLHTQRVNKVNLRKEFFNCTLDELENLVYELEPTASFNRTMLAEQYNQSLAIDFIPESVITEFGEEAEYGDEENS